MFGTESRKGVSRGIIVLIFLSLVFCAFPAFAAEVSEVGEAEYVVRAGDTLEGIARQYGVDVNELAALNGITNKSLINTGQTLKIPGIEPAPAAETTPGAPNASWDSSYISIDVREVDIRDVLSALAVSTGTNIVYKGGATDITLRLENITPLAALDYVTRIANLIYQREGGMIIVASRSDMRSYFYEEEAIALFKFHYLTGNQVAEKFTGFMPASINFVYHEGGRRYLWAKGLPGELARIREVLEVMDTPDNIMSGSDAIPDHLRYIQLSYLNATDFGTILTGLGFASGWALQNDSMNLLYLGNEDDFAVIAKIQEIVDVKQSSTTVKRVIDFTTDPDEGYERLQIRRDLICEMTGISPSRFYISSNIAKSSGSTRYIMYLRGTPEEAAEVERVVTQIGE
ncbi:MAG: LysM peptidoglycan-binding domain-containing protein [Gracilibacteraceae bacterium]|nr:LysM peptidoglycan-binding domain-containing protein [Gracilibacteraceae bacterium]